MWPFNILRKKAASMFVSMGGGSTYSGKNVTIDRALQLSTVWACVRLLAETISTLPLVLYERDGESGKKVARLHPLYALLHDQPNADMTAVEFWECMICSIALWGNAYAEKTLSGGVVIAITPLRPEFMTVKRNEVGALIYSYTDPKNRRSYTEDQIMHIKGFGVDGLMGLSPIGYARQSLASAMSTEEAAGKTFANSMITQGFLKHDKLLTDPQRKKLRESLNEFKGSEKAGDFMILEADLDFKPISMNPQDAQMLETRAFHVEELCRWFRVPPFMIGHTEKVTSWGTGLEQQMIGFLTFTLRPYLMRIEQSIKRCLLSPEDRANYFAEFNLEGLLRADSAGRAALYSTTVQNGIYTRNEVRSKENLPPLPGGDVLTVQSNLVPIEQLGKQAAPPVGKSQEFGKWQEFVNEWFRKAA